MTFKIEEGKQYQLKDGREYRFLMLDELSQRMIGAYRDRDEWVPIVHDMEGYFYGPDRESVCDLMERPEMQEWCITIRRRVVADRFIHVIGKDRDDAIEKAKALARNGSEAGWNELTTTYQVVNEEVHNG